MPRWQRVYLSACAGIIAYMLAYVGVDYARVAHPTYFQLEREWRLASRVAGLPSGYVGLWLWALAAGLLCGAATYLALRWRRAPIGDRALGLGLAWTLSAVLLAVGYYSWNNWP